MPIPSEKDTESDPAGCYLKITFPKEMPLPDPTDSFKALTYQSADDNMMSNSRGGNDLSVGSEVFNQQQEY